MGLRDYLHYKQAHTTASAARSNSVLPQMAEQILQLWAGTVQTDAVLPLYGIITTVWHHYRGQTTTSDRRRTIDHFLQWEFSCQWLDNGGLLYHQPPSVHHLEGFALAHLLWWILPLLSDPRLVSSYPNTCALTMKPSFKMANGQRDARKALCSYSRCKIFSSRRKDWEKRGYRYSSL